MRIKPCLILIVLLFLAACASAPGAIDDNDGSPTVIEDSDSAA